MSIRDSGIKSFSLFEVTKSIQKTVADRYQQRYWVRAEMNKLNYYSHSGHCYPELVEKQDGKVIAQMKASLWKEDYLNINRNFLRVLKEPLKDGIKVLLLAKISFDPAYGMSLRIIDIDPAFTLGDIEQEKQHTLSQLQEHNIFNRNKELRLPLLPKRIAIISVETSKGYADFLKVLDTNAWGYTFFHLLFPSLLQGDKMADAMITQLRNIESVKSHFDVVAIIRGGGGDVGLSCYNNYELAKEIALFPLPVITGIGHATNETVCEMVSFADAITPTKLAEFLLQKFHNFSVPVKRAEEKIVDRTKRLLTDERTNFESKVKLLRAVTDNILVTKRNELREKNQSVLYRSAAIISAGSQQITIVKQKITAGAQNLFRANGAELLNIKKNVANLDPVNVLKRGFSITYFNGKILKDSAAVKNGDLISTQLLEGKIISTVNSNN